MEEIVECATRAVALDDRGDYDGALEAYAVVCEKLFAFIPTCKKGGKEQRCSCVVRKYPHPEGCESA